MNNKKISRKVILSCVVLVVLLLVVSAYSVSPDTLAGASSQLYDHFSYCRLFCSF